MLNSLSGWSLVDYGNKNSIIDTIEMITKIMLNLMYSGSQVLKWV